MNVRPKFNSVSSRAFNQDTAAAKRAAKDGPVFITTRGEPTHVLMSYEAFKLLEGEKPKGKSLAEALHDQNPDADFDWEPPRMSDDWGLKIPDFDD